MRYDNWDIILFPEDSNIPIPEYKTACYFSRDEDGRELPTLRTYIGSLKPETPFRISVHHWGPPKPSPLMQDAQRKAGLDIAFTLQVIIDGTRLYYGGFAANTTLPREIVYEERSFKWAGSDEQPTSQAKQRLIFPRSDKNALLQSSAWQPRGTDNRIKIILSEGLIREDSSLEAACCDIVCFSFQHASRELLEQAGIAYPVIDPLRSLIGERATIVPAVVPRNTLAHDIHRGTRVHADLLPDTDIEPIRPSNPEPHDPPSRRFSYPTLPGQFVGHRGGGTQNCAYGPFVDEDVSMGSWHSQRNASGTALPGYYGPPFAPYAVSSWPHTTALPAQHVDPDINRTRHQKGSETRQVMMAFREDQFGQILEAISPSKKQYDKLQRRPHRSNVQNHRPPKMAALSVPVRPTSAALARPVPSADSNSNMRRAKRPSSDRTSSSAKAPFKVDTHPSHLTHDHRDSRISAYNPFVREGMSWDSDVSMKDESSIQSSRSRFAKGPVALSSKIGSAHAPSAGGEIKSRKEGHAGVPLTGRESEVRHDQSLLQAMGSNTSIQATPAEDSNNTGRRRRKEKRTSDFNDVEVIDVDAIDPSLVTGATANPANLSPFKPGHNANMSSISSTGRLERQLYSALGEELSSFEQRINAAGMGPELAQALSGVATRSERGDSAMLDPTVSEFEPAAKRKRRETYNDERGTSPVQKKEKAQKATVETEGVPEDMPQLRGD